MNEKDLISRKYAEYALWYNVKKLERRYKRIRRKREGNIINVKENSDIKQINRSKEIKTYENEINNFILTWF